MSLINDVLRDLDERRERRDEGARPTLTGLRPAPRPPASGRRTRGVFGVALALALAAALVSETPREAGLPAVAAPPPEPVAMSVAPPPVIASEIAREIAREIEPAAKPRPKAEPAPLRRAARPARPRPTAAPAVVAAPEPEPAAPPPCERLVQRALEQAAQGETVAARERLGDCLAADPRQRQAREALATLLARSGQAAEAIALLRGGRVLLEEDTAFSHLEARIRAEHDDVDGAVGLLERQAGDPESDALRGALYQTQGRHLEAAHLYSSLVVQDASRPTWWIGLGISYEALGEPDRAAAAYRHAAALGHLGGEARAWLGARLAALADPG